MTISGDPLKKIVSPQDTPLKSLDRNIPKATVKTDDIAQKILRYKQIAKGAEKRVLEEVLVLKDLIAPPHSKAKSVFYVPAKTLLGSKENALRKEVHKLNDIKTLSKDMVGAQYLALDVEEVTGDSKIEGQYTLKTKKAERDFEKEIIDPKVNYKDRLSFVGNYIDGMSALHSSGYAFGDIKPENCLIYAEDKGKSLKISDFGKAIKLDEKEQVTYKGNLRFAPPEGQLSKKGDVYGAAILMIRTLEEPLLDKNTPDPLIPVKPKDQEKVQALDKRRGVERMIVNHKAFSGIDEPTLKDKIFRRLPRQVALKTIPEEQKKQQNIVLKLYITELCMKLKQLPEFKDKKAQITQLGSLLKSMVQTDPAKRPSMEEVATKYKSMFAERVDLENAKNTYIEKGEIEDLS